MAGGVFNWCLKKDSVKSDLVLSQAPLSFPAPAPIRSHSPSPKFSSQREVQEKYAGCRCQVLSWPSRLSKHGLRTTGDAHQQLSRGFRRWRGRSSPCVLEDSTVLPPREMLRSSDGSPAPQLQATLQPNQLPISSSGPKAVFSLFLQGNPPCCTSPPALLAQPFLKPGWEPDNQ